MIGGVCLPLAIAIAGSPSAPAVMLCPGLGMAASSWRRVERDLAADHAVVTYDRPGLGRQRHRRPLHPPTLDGEMARLGLALRAVDAVAGHAPAEHVVPAVLVAHSMAAFWVEAWARIHPETVRGLVFVDASIEETPAPRSGVWTSLRAGVGALAAVMPGPMRTGGAALLEDAAYHGMAADLEVIRGNHPLPCVPIVLLAATVTGATRWERRRLGRQKAWAQRLETEQLGRGSQVRYEVVRRSGHRVMRDAPERICGAVRSVTTDR